MAVAVKLKDYRVNSGQRHSGSFEAEAEFMRLVISKVRENDSDEQREARMRTINLSYF